MNKPVVLLDADVIFAGAAAPKEHGASHVILQLGEIGLINCVTSVQVVTEVERNFEKKLSKKLPELRLLMSRSLDVIPDPEPEKLLYYKGQADPKDLPILVSALEYDCRYLLTFNIRHYAPATDKIVVQRPGEFLTTIRSLLAQMATGTGKK
jgi:hypothetical protein